MGSSPLLLLLVLATLVLDGATGIQIRTSANEALNASFSRSFTSTNQQNHVLWPRCPIQQCRNKKWRKSDDESLLQLESQEMERLGRMGEPNQPQEYYTGNGPGPLGGDTHRGKQHEVDKDTGISIYNIDFQPGHFTCMSCDTGACPGCDVICDLSKCMGTFYTQECWCQKATDVRLRKPLWWFRKYDARYMPGDNIYQLRCDTNCKGALCDTDKLQCKPREEACKPWWWCKGVDPPKKDNLVPKDGWPAGFSYTSSLTLLQQKTMKERAERRRERVQSPQKRLEAFRQTRAEQIAAMKERMSQNSNQTRMIPQQANPPHGTENLRLLQGEEKVAEVEAANGMTNAQGRDFEPNDFGKMSFAPGRWVCESAALPPQVQNPSSYIWEERGYVVFDKYKCQGGAFDHKCYCWNEPLYLQGKDPKAGSFSCDSTCTWGACEGRTCGQSPPPPLPPPPPPPAIDPVDNDALHEGELNTMYNKPEPFQG